MRTNNSSPGLGHLFGVATVVESAGARIAGLETSDVQEETAHFDDAVWRVDAIVEEHAHFVFVGTEKHLRALGREFAAHEHVLQVIEAGILPECVDRGQTTGVRLRIRDGDQKKRQKEDSDNPPNHSFILLCASRSGRR